MSLRKGIATSVAVTSVILAAVGCRGSNSDQGYGDAVAAVYAGSVYGFDGPLTGRLILVDVDGAVTTVPTEGIYMGSVTEAGGIVHVSDSTSEVLIDRHGVQAIQRSTEHDMELWSAEIDGVFWTLFNDGTLGTSEYHTGVAAVSDRRVTEGDVSGDVVGVTVCAGGVALAVGKWAKRFAQTGTRLLTLSLEDSRIRHVERGVVDLPRGSHVTNLACSDGDLLVLAQRHGRPILGDQVNGDQWRWRSPSAGAMGPILFDEKMLGVFGGRIVMWDPFKGVYAVDIETLATTRLAEMSSTVDQVGVSGGELILWQTRPNPMIRWIDPVTGAVVREVDGTGVMEVLRSEDEDLARPPISLPGVSHIQ